MCIWHSGETSGDIHKLSNALTPAHSGKVRYNGKQLLVLKLNFWDCSKNLVVNGVKYGNDGLVKLQIQQQLLLTKPSDLNVYPYTLHTTQIITPNSAENAAIVGGLIFYHIFPNNLLQWIEQLLLIFLILPHYTDGTEPKIWVLFSLYFFIVQILSLFQIGI